MFRWSVLFWIAVVAAIGWCVSVFFMSAVSESYFPMEAKGDLFQPLRMMMIVGVILTMIVMSVLEARRGPLAPLAYKIGLVILVLISLIPFLPRVDNGYEQTYFLNDQRHDVPWQYAPSSGKDVPGGRYFLARVALPDMGKNSHALSQTITIGKAIDVNNGRGGEIQNETCVTGKYNTKCEWQRGDFFYSASGDTDLFPSDVTEILTKAADLLDSFEVTSP